MTSAGKGGKHRSFRPRVLEAFPKERHLTHRYARTFDVREELRSVYSDEEARYSLLFKAPPEPEPRSIFVVPKAPKPQTALSRSASSPSTVKTPAENLARRKPGSLRPFNMPQDPTKMPNPHDERHDIIEAQIAEREKHLAESRSESALQFRCGFEVKAASFHWDHHDPGLFLTESKASFFPRSVGKVREFGSGRDPRYCRPYDETYLHREAVIRNKHVQRF
mmetsp:Transcript_2510/g.6769  ORF Transcript_2510/g.6769 Transcript_2510/m.6769 type:complete len:222 (-) Transcript_2510:89-754(-)